MWIKEVCAVCGLTKKAVEYYEKKGLISPETTEGGYRDFSREDVGRLQKIALLRELGMSVEDIRQVLCSDSPARLLAAAARKQEAAIADARRKQRLLARLGEGAPFDEISAEAAHLVENQTILDRLQRLFPGPYGRFIGLHFAPYLQDPIETEEQRAAGREIVAFLDNAEQIDFPDELMDYLEEVTSHWDPDELQRGMQEGLDKMLGDTEAYLDDNKESLEQYMAYRRSEEFRQSPAGRMQELLRQFQRQSGYLEIFLPNLRRLSPSYRAYMEQLEAANGVFLSRYPDAAGWNDD